MLIFLIKLFLLLIAVTFTDNIVYKHIRKVDLKERKKIDQYELEQVDKLVEKLSKIKAKDSTEEEQNV